MNLEMIEKMKQNRVVLELLTQEEREAIGSAGDSIEYWSYSGGWQKTSQGLRSQTIYRICSDYQPTLPGPKLVKCEVKIFNCQLTFIYSGMCYQLSRAIDLPNFDGFKTEDDNENVDVPIEYIATKIRRDEKVFVVFIEKGE